VAAGDNFIWDWGGAPGGYVIDQDEQKVTITAPGTFMFAASDEADPGNLGVIRLIKIQDEGVAGTVDLHVTQPNEPSYPGVARGCATAL
jgi:hypothetical protein